MEDRTENKRSSLLSYMSKLTKNNVCLAFSGGVDSSLILYAAMEEALKNGKMVTAVLFHTKLHPMGDVKEAREIAAKTGADFHIIPIDEWKEIEAIHDNPRDRCYLCKKLLFTKLLAFARERGIDTVIDGTNYDDLFVYRPGVRALRELGIKSPLAELSLTKQDVRALAADYDIALSDKPSAPCLATRLPYGDRLNQEELSNLDKGEQFIKSLGFKIVRLRKHREIIRIEVEEADFSLLLKNKAQIIQFLKELGFHYITMDIEGFRSGSMDEPYANQSHT